MKPSRVLLAGVLMFPLLSVAAQDEMPDRFALNLGTFFIVDSDIDFVASGGTVLGTNINFDRDLGGDEYATAPRVKGYWRFNPRHRVDFGWYRIEREGRRTVGRDIEFGNVVFPLTTRLDSSIDLEVAKLAYTWSFYHVDKVELALSFGANVIDYQVELRNPDRTLAESASVYEPLPVFGMRMDYAANDRWHVLFDFETFYLELTDDVRGSMSDLQVGVEYRPLPYLSLGASLNRLTLDARIDEEDYVGSLTDLYRGGQLYVGLRY